MRNLLPGLALAPLAAMALTVGPAKAQVVERDVVVVEQAVPAPVVERRTYRVVRTYRAPVYSYRAPVYSYYRAPSYTYRAPVYGYRAPGYTYAATTYYTAPAAETYYTAPAYVRAGTGDCRRLYRRAAATGSLYWWDRYSECEE